VSRESWGLDLHLPCASGWLECGTSLYVMWVDGVTLARCDVLLSWWFAHCACRPPASRMLICVRADTVLACPGSSAWTWEPRTRASESIKQALVK
jgi:hypothetical protein